jgi:hypothetical protein
MDGASALLRAGVVSGRRLRLGVSARRPRPMAGFAAAPVEIGETGR